MFRGFRYRSRAPAPAVVTALADGTTIDAATGAVRSIQTAELALTGGGSSRALAPARPRAAGAHLLALPLARDARARSASTTRDARRTVVLLRRPLRLLRFKAPEYEMDARARHGPLAHRRRPARARRGHHGDGYLQIDVRAGRRRPEPGSRASASRSRSRTSTRRSRARLSRPVYRVTQSRIHVLVTYGFLRSLARLDLAESRVGRFPALTATTCPTRRRPNGGGSRRRLSRSARR